MKPLLVFAHRGEAQSFFKFTSYKSLQKTFLELYTSKENYLLISGEGIQATTETLSTTLALLQNDISFVLNLGIAGSLNKKIKPLTSVDVRTAYCEAKQNKMVFHSFTSSDKNTTLDCVTTIERVLEASYASFLRPFADFVDRELWAIGSVCHRYKTPFRATKIISDIAGNNTDCFDISNRAIELSEALLTSFKKKYHLKLKEPPKKVFAFKLPEAFYTTIAQKRELSRLVTYFREKEEKKYDKYLQLLEALQHLKASPKERTQKLIKEAKYLRNPYRKKIEEQLHEFSRPLSQIGCHVSFDNQLEKESFRISMSLEHQQNITRLKKVLETLSFHQFLDIINGENDP